MGLDEVYTRDIGSLGPGNLFYALMVSWALVGPPLIPLVMLADAFRGDHVCVALYRPSCRLYLACGVVYSKLMR